MTESPKIESPYLTLTEAAAYIRRTPKALYALKERRKLLPLPGHRKHYYTKELLDRFMQAGEN
jgi:hypothetical protein